MPDPYRILCVEDSFEMQQMLHFILSRAGFQIIVASNGDEGVISAKVSRPDLILMDIMLAGNTTGINAITRIKADPAIKQTPIVVLSAYTDQALVDNALSAGALTYLEKNILPEKLIKTINYYLNSPQSSPQPIDEIDQEF